MLKIRSLVLITVLSSGLVWAQTTETIVSGTVTDQSGAAIGGVPITARNLATGVITTTTSNEVGVYLFPPLQPGRYDFSAEQAGFTRAVTAGVTLEAGTRIILNHVLQIGSTSESVTVQAEATLLTSSTATIGGTVEDRRLQELPITGRDAFNFISLWAGFGSVGSSLNGTRTGALNVTTDGISTLSNRIDGINTSGIVNSSGVLGTTAFQNAARVDRVQEVHVITSPADVEYGRGMGQVQLITRSGTNQFHGSVFEEHRNTVLNANNWFSNAAGTNRFTGSQIQPRPILLSNQFGGRIGGPVIRNKTFFNIYYEGQRQVAKDNIIANVLTESARRGSFRFYPGFQNTNITGANPTVDINGSPILPRGADPSLQLQSLSLFGLDPNRPAPDQSGVLAQNIQSMPTPNYFLVGDGLNTAGFAWQRRTRTTFNTYETRIDQNFSQNHRLTVSYNHVGFNTELPGGLPTSPIGKAVNGSMLAIIGLNSVLRPNVVNQLRIGVYRPRIHVFSGYDEATGGDKSLYKKNGSPYLIVPGTFTPVVPIDSALDGYANVTPNYQYGDTISWLRGRHSLKGGFEARFISYSGWDIANVVPRVSFGNPPVAPSGLNTTNLPGIGANLSLAQLLLADLAGSVSNVSQTLTAPGYNQDFLPGLAHYATIKQPEFSWFFKDDIKVSTSLTVNAGVRYELYRVPWESHGIAVAPVGGSSGFFGISGTSWADLFQPGVLKGQLVQPRLIGPNGPNPGVSLFRGDHNNFAPGVGFAYSLPWFGKEKTVFRAGYGVSYERTSLYTTQLPVIYAPGIRQNFNNAPTTYTNLNSVSVPVTPTNRPMEQIPLNNNPFASRILTFSGYDDALRTPYIQNWQASIARELPGDMSIEIRYVGTKGTKLLRGTNINEVNTVENGIGAAFQAVQSGGASPLLDRIFAGINPALTGSQYVLTGNATLLGFLANNNVGGFASFINQSNLGGTLPGNLLLRSNLPQNFVVASPQYATSFLIGNQGASTYHALQLEFTKRYSAGLNVQSNFTWNRYLGDYNSGGTPGPTNIEDTTYQSSFRTVRNKRLDKTILDRKFFWRSNAIYELPFGPGKILGRNSNGVVAQILGGWQLGTIFNVFSGFPFSLGASNSSFNTVAVNNLPNLQGSVPKGRIQRVQSGVQFFPDYSLIPDPQIANFAPNVRAISPLQAVADSSAKIILSNAPAGTIGNMAPNSIYGPGYFQFDANLLKRFRLSEGKDLLVGANATNVLNHPQFNFPLGTGANFDSPNFGRITNTIIPNRVIVLTGRVTF